jgi:hypothetical protein
VPLTLQHCQALGVLSSTDAGWRRTLNEAGRRVCAAERSFQAFQAHGGRGRDSFLRITRQPPPGPPLDRPHDPVPQLSLAAQPAGPVRRIWSQAPRAREETSWRLAAFGPHGSGVIGTEVSPAPRGSAQLKSAR